MSHNNAIKPWLFDARLPLTRHLHRCAVALPPSPQRERAGTVNTIGVASSSMEAAERDAMLTLNLVPGLGPTLIRRCIEAFGSAQAALEASIRGLTSVKGISERVARNVKRSIEEFQADQSSIDRERQLIESTASL